LEADFFQAVKSYVIYNIIVPINGNGNFLPWISAGEKRMKNMRNQTNKTKVSSHN